MGADGLVWVCCGAGSTGGAQKQCMQRTKLVVQALIWALWPGKFPQTSCLQKYKSKEHGRLRMGTHGFVWVQWGVFARGGRGQENKGKRGRIRWSGHVLQVCPRTTKTARIMLDSFCKKKTENEQQSHST